MKKLMMIMLIAMAFISCKDDEKKDTETINDESAVASDEVVLTGSFMYYSDAAVFQTNSELFGVVENEKLQDLILQSETLKNDASDEVNVTLKVKKTKKPENQEGWDNRVEILEIIKVSKANPEDNKIIKLGKENEVM